MSNAGISKGRYHHAALHWQNPFSTIGSAFEPGLGLVSHVAKSNERQTCMAIVDFINRLLVCRYVLFSSFPS